MKSAYGVILAGGVGKRMGQEIPKQFIQLRDVPIIIRTIRCFLSCHSFRSVVIAIHPEWNDFFLEILANHEIDTKRILVVPGGEERYDSILNALRAIRQNFPVDESDVVVIHDAVRPFVSLNLLENSIAASMKYGACVATVPATDTMLVVKEGMVVDVPRRSELYNGQAPDSVRLMDLERAIDSLTNEEKKMITGTAQICVLKGIPVRAIPGEYSNIKITTPHDLEVGGQILDSWRKE